jgi:hypothetical protein
MGPPYPRVRVFLTSTWYQSLSAGSFFLPPSRRLSLSPSLLPAVGSLSLTLAGQPAAAQARRQVRRVADRPAAALCRARPPQGAAQARR